MNGWLDPNLGLGWEDALFGSRLGRCSTWDTKHNCTAFCHSHDLLKSKYK
jgi:hypothetical protein